MKRNKYRLQPVLEFRDKEKQAAAQHLADCRAQLVKEEEELARCQRAVEECHEKQLQAHNTMLEEAEQGTHAHKLIFHRTYIADLIKQEEELVEAVEKQKTVVARAEKAVEKAIEKLAEASKELKVIEKHRDKWKENKKIEDERREQKSLDEFGSTTYKRQR